MKQYNSMKSKYPDALLLFRVGDFYETFGKDAIKTSKILDIVLTKRANGAASHVELAGFPHHALNTYLPKLVRAGQRIAICDQLEDPKTTKKLVKRGVTELVTPGVSLNDEVLEASKNNFLSAIHFGKKEIGIGFLDVSTGEFLIGQGTEIHVKKLVESFLPSEVIYQKQKKKLYESLFGETYYTYRLEDWAFESSYSEGLLLGHFKTNSLKGFGIDDLEEAKVAAGVILNYLSETQHDKLKHITSIKRIHTEDFVWMDDFTIRNLELFYSSNSQAVTLFEVIDQTLTPMGARMLKRWLALPLKSHLRIQERLSMVEGFLKDEQFLTSIQRSIKQIADTERLSSKIATARISPREMNTLKRSLIHLNEIQVECSKSSNQHFKSISQQIHSCSELIELIKKNLMEDAPVFVGKGNAIANGVSEELDEIRTLAFSSKQLLNDMCKRESEASGIPSLKIGFNNVFGYYIEVRNTHKNRVPKDWTRKQTLVNAERYVTQELKDYESKILSAEEKIHALENQLYSHLVEKSSAYINQLQSNAQIVAKIDCLQGFATLAKDHQYTQPIITDDRDLEIIEGKHPVIEKQLPIGEPYISNSVRLSPDDQQIIMITGPNMSGKSAVLRQTALIVILAQIGSYVPARKAQIGIVDKIFTRVGASDNISKGESTFMVEMNETANILNNLSDRSLILLDEIGRGTSTYDGISIAWAVAEYLHEHKHRPKTLFATHYHELNEMAQSFSRIKNFNVSVKEAEDKIIFMRKLRLGGSEHSFGIHVAKMAGMPSSVSRRAEELLEQMERFANRNENNQAIKKFRKEKNMQLSIFQLDDPVLENIRDALIKVDINRLTPVEALLKLNEIKSMVSASTGILPKISKPK